MNVPEWWLLLRWLHKWLQVEEKILEIDNFFNIWNINRIFMLLVMVTLQAREWKGIKSFVKISLDLTISSIYSQVFTV